MGFSLGPLNFGPNKGAPFLPARTKIWSNQPEINSGWRWMFSKFLWPWGSSDFQCATLGSCDSCCVRCPPHSPAPKDLGPNCDTCGSNGNPIIPFLPVLTSKNFKHPDPPFLEGIHSSCNYQKPMQPTWTNPPHHHWCLIPDPRRIEERISKNITIALKTPRKRLEKVLQFQRLGSDRLDLVSLSAQQKRSRRTWNLKRSGCNCI